MTYDKKIDDDVFGFPGDRHKLKDRWTTCMAKFSCEKEKDSDYRCYVNYHMKNNIKLRHITQ